jgi:hypothetical protein
VADLRKAQTTTIGGGAIYAKVAERLKLFREDNPKGKQESAFEPDVDGSMVFTVWLWKDKTDLIDLMKAGVTDKDVLHSSADANGNAKGQLGGKEKDFEKLESVALGRALAMLGYLASGEIASSEEMEQFEDYKEQKALEEAEDFIKQIGDTKSNQEMNKILAGNQGMLKNRLVVEAAKVKQAEFAEADKLKKPATPPAKSKTPEAVALPKDLKEPADVKNN